MDAQGLDDAGATGFGLRGGRGAAAALLLLLLQKEERFGEGAFGVCGDVSDGGKELFGFCLEFELELEI